MHDENHTLFELPATVRCPECKNFVGSELSNCRFCGADLAPAIAVVQARLDKNVRLREEEAARAELARAEAELESLERLAARSASRKAFIVKWRRTALGISGVVVPFLIAAMYLHSGAGPAAQACAQLNGQVLPAPVGDTIRIDDFDGTFECTIFVLSGYVGVDHFTKVRRIPNFQYVVIYGGSGVIEISTR